MTITGSYLVGKIYQCTGALFNQEWYDENVKKTLFNCYPQDLAENTYKYMLIPGEIEERIENLDFDIEEEIFGLSGEELISVWDQMYAKVYIETYREM